MGVAVCLNEPASTSAPSRSSTTPGHSRCRNCPPPRSRCRQPTTPTRRRLQRPRLRAVASRTPARLRHRRQRRRPRLPPRRRLQTRPLQRQPKCRPRLLRSLRLRRTHLLWTLLLRPYAEADAFARRPDASYRTVRCTERAKQPPLATAFLHPLPAQTGSHAFIRFIVQRSFQRLFFLVPFSFSS